MRAFIVPGRDSHRIGRSTPWGDTLFSLVAEDGECLCSHMCSSWHFAPGDLYGNRPERAELFSAKGIAEFLWADEAEDITEEELLQRNHARASEDGDA